MNIQKITDNEYEKILKIISHNMMPELELLVPFEEIEEKNKEQILTVILKTIEVSTSIMSELIKDAKLDQEKIDTILNLMNEGKNEEAYKNIYNINES